MESIENVISGSCSIHEQKVIIDGKVGFEGNIDWSMPEFLKKVYKNFEMKYPKFYKMDPLTKLGFTTAEILLRDKNLNEKYDDADIGIVILNRSSSIDIDKAFQLTIDDNDNYYPSPALFVYTLPNIMAGEICIRHKFKGENTVFIRKEFSAKFIQDYVSLLFQKKKAKVCIAGWVEVNHTQYKSLLMLVENTIFANSYDSGHTFDTNAINKLF